MSGPRSRTVLVTGASSGIGAAVAVALAAESAVVVLAGRDRERLADVRTAVEAAGAQGIEVAVELVDDVQLAQLAQTAAGATGAIDVLVHSAGVYRPTPLAQLERAALEREWAINVLAPLRLTQAALPYLPSGASVVFISSVSGRVGFAGDAAYAATKGAIESMVRSLSVELAPQGVRVNGVAPGFTATPMNAAARTDERLVRTAEAATSSGRLGRPEDVAAAVVYLASEAAAQVRGVTLPVDGGFPVSGLQQGLL
ncbi:MAG TPA: SDR family oxidoreductase [Conexibacter sp.]|jgi:NAD(P)-dependent dehydrogenase (short-subunit alcohol dehydrogenase family)|nr:SDR family oxidoreductase [Conexibacter sp.]